LGEGGEHLAAPQLLRQHHLALGTDAVRLKHVLGEIQTDRANLHVDGSLMVIRSTTTTLWHFDAGSGRRPPHQGEVVGGLASGDIASRGFQSARAAATPTSTIGASPSSLSSSLAVNATACARVSTPERSATWS